MFRFLSIVRAFLRDRSGVSTADWVGSTAVFFILSAAVVYGVLGGKQSGLAKFFYGEETAGLATIVNSQSERVGKDSANIDAMLTEVNEWTPEGE